MTSVAAFRTTLRAAFAAHANAERAQGAAAYMRGQFSFYGIDSPTRRTIQRKVEQDLGLPSDVLTLAERLWNDRERECQYAACDLLRKPRVLRALSPADLPRIERLIVTKSWWDTVDALAPKIAGAILRPFPDLVRSVALTWIGSENIWLQRSAILLQLDFKHDTNIKLLTTLILRRADSTEFFVRKGAGWALRQLSYTDPNAVREFLIAHGNSLSALTRREAGKYVL